MQSPVGLVDAVIAFFHSLFSLYIGKLRRQAKEILGGLAGVALLISGITSVDFNPPSVERGAKQTSRVSN